MPDLLDSMLPLLKKPRVLVLDDDASVRRLVSLVLKRAGFKVETVTKGNDAIAAIESAEGYAAILLDLMMPHEGGLTVLRHLRKSNPSLLKKVIVMTAAPETVVRSLRKDVSGVVRKPFEAANLTAAVQKLAR